MLARFQRVERDLRVEVVWKRDRDHVDVRAREERPIVVHELGDPEALYSLAPASGRYLGERDHARGRVQLEARQVVLADPARADHGDIVV